MANEKKKKTGKKIGSQKLAKKKVGKTEKKKKLAKNWLAILANFPTSVAEEEDDDAAYFVKPKRFLNFP